MRKPCVVAGREEPGPFARDAQRAIAVPLNSFGPGQTSRANLARRGSNGTTRPG